MPQYVAALDQGTSSTRCMVFDHSGRVKARAQKEHQQIYPRAGWVEHDPLEIWARCQDVISGALERAGLSRKDLVALGVTNQRETTIVWDRKSGKPVCNAIVWQDLRTDGICRALARAGGIDRLRSRTGLPLATYFSGPKIKWVLDNVPGARLRAERRELLFGNMDTWLIWNLSHGLHVTDVTNASRTLLMDLRTLDWDSDILELLEIPPSMLPEIRPSSGILGIATGQLNGVPIAGDLGDQQAALFGQACFSPGEAKNTYGTGCFMLLNTGHDAVVSQQGLLTTVAYQIGEQQPTYALEGSVAIAGALVQWLRDNLGIIENSSDIESLARSVPDTADIYFVPAFSGLFAPYWRSEARGAILGMTRYVNKGHIARAALEATAFQTRDVAQAMESDSGVKFSELKVDGGMVSNELLMQFQADILNVPLIRPKVAETTALGAAYAAGLAVGFWQDLGQLRSLWSEDQRWVPQMEVALRDRLCAGWKKAVERTFD